MLGLAWGVIKLSNAAAYEQAIIILGSNSEPPSCIPPFYSSALYLYMTQATDATFALGGGEMFKTEWRIINTSFSSVPIIWESELNAEYRELGEALSGMSELTEGDEWRIDTPVYTAASNVAAVLRANSIQAPRVFNHGPKSVVFNWSNNADNLYLTVSADHISALISSPQRIKRRIEFSAHDLVDSAHTIAFVKAAFLEKPATRLITATVYGPTEVSA
jgi:hypothetical protein